MVDWMENEVFRAFTTYAAIVTLKMMLMGPLTAYFRITRGVSGTRQDADLSEQDLYFESLPFKVGASAAFPERRAQFRRAMLSPNQSDLSLQGQLLTVNVFKRITWKNGAVPEQFLHAVFV